jgi:hypothetical protein
MNANLNINDKGTSIFKYISLLSYRFLRQRNIDQDLILSAMLYIPFQNIKIKFKVYDTVKKL